LLFVYVFWPGTDLRLALILFLGSMVLIGQDIVLSHKPRWFDLALGAIVFTLYLITLGDHVGRADTFEFQVVMPQLGIAHPTGYPLFIMIGKLFSLLPFGSMAFRVNLLSAIYATGAVMLIYRTIVSLTFDRRAAATGALILAASPAFWSQAIVVEVYALNALFVAIILFLLLRLFGQTARGGLSNPPHSAGFDNPARANDLEPKIQNPKSKICLLAFVFGLALTHHLTTAILIPAIASALLLAKPKLPIKSWLIAIGLFLLGLTPWLYIVLRWPGLHNGAAMPIGEWIGWIFGQRFGGALNLSLWNDPTRWSIITRITLEQFGWIGVALTALGMPVLIKRAPRIALITFVIFAGYFFYGLIYNVPDVAVFIIPAFMMMAMWIGVAISFVVETITGQRVVALLGSSLITRHALRATLLIVASLLPLALIAANFSLVDQHGRDADLEAWGRSTLLSWPIPEHAAILVDSEKIAPLYYLQVTEHIRPDLEIIVLGDEALYRQELDRRINAGQAVYLARFLPNLPYRMRSLGPLVEVSREPMMTVPAFDRSIHASFGGEIDLLGVTGGESSPYDITLYWQAVSPERKNYHVRLRLIDANETIWWEDPGAHPVGGYYPTGAWQPGEIVSDFHAINIEPFVPAGTYDLEVGLFTPFRDDGLSDWLKVAKVTVAPPAPEPLAHQVRIVSSELALTSVDRPGDVPPSSEVATRVNAIGRDTPSNVVLSLVGDNGTAALTATQVIRPGQSRLMFRAPDQNGTYALRLKFDSPARCHWLAPLTTDCEIGLMRVVGEAIGNAINFDNQVLLTNAKIDRDILRPNESIRVDLSWRGLKTWPDDYTAFVHLIGPDGRVHGQVDQWPVQGTLPTSSWTVGQVVNDPYVVTLPPDAPSGKYQIEVGWYLLSTLRRLSVLDASGRPSDDKVIVGEFSVP